MATTAGEIWELFFTEEILNIIVKNTNRLVHGSNNYKDTKP
jgi:hypothetical protein